MFSSFFFITNILASEHPFLLHIRQQYHIPRDEHESLVWPAYFDGRMGEAGEMWSVSAHWKIMKISFNIS